MASAASRILVSLIVSGATVGSSLAQVSPESTELIRRGDAVLTLGDLDGRMSRLADVERATHAREPANLSRMIDRLLLNRQLAIEARELGLHERSNVRKDIELAVEEVLATHRLNLLVQRDNLPDFGPLARERYLADPGKFGVRETRRVVHLLVDNTERSDEEALARAIELRGLAVSGEAQFRDLVAEHSDDPGKERNQGHYAIQKSGEFVPEFEAAARALAAPGDVSEPVKTRFGYHVIKLLEIEPARTASFEDVQATLISELREAYINEVRGKHGAELRGLEDVGNEELMLTLPARYGGRPEEAGAPTMPADAPADAGR